MYLPFLSKEPEYLGAANRGKPSGALDRAGSAFEEWNLKILEWDGNRLSGGVRVLGARFEGNLLGIFGFWSIEDLV